MKLEQLALAAQVDQIVRNAGKMKGESDERFDRASFSSQWLLHSGRLWDFALSAADRQDRKSTTRAELLQGSQPIACPITVKPEERNVSKSSPLLPSS